MAVMAPMTRTESTGPLSMVSGSSSAPTGPQPRGRPRPANRHWHRPRAAWAKRRARGHDSGRILVTVVSMSRLLVVAEMSRARWPSSPTARSCGCLHRGSNAQAVSKTGEAARSLARAGRQRKGRRASAGAESTDSGRRGSGHRARACGLMRVRVQHAHRPRARSGRADRSCAVCVAAGRSGGHTCGWWVGIPGLRRDW